MGNAVSGEEWEERLESARRSRRRSRLSDLSRARPPAGSESESESESDDWEVLSAEATAQTPSQQYYPPPLSVRLEAAARRREEHDRLRARAGAVGFARQSVYPSWRQPVRQPERQPVGWGQVGMALAVAGAACMEVLAENQRAKEDAKQQLAKKGEEESKKGEKSKTEEVEEAEEALENAEESYQQFAPSAPPAALPEICPHHPGCTAPACDRLHLCRLFLAEQCPLGGMCPRGHSLTTVHNQRVCDRYGLDTGRADQCIALLKTSCRERPDSLQPAPDSLQPPPDSLQPPLQPAQLSICFMQHVCGGSCNRLHLCRGWVTGDCARTVCKFGHEPLTAHNMDVLERHGLLQADARTIGRLLANKYTARPAQGTTTAGSHGAVHRPTPCGGAAAPAAAAAVPPLSDELQCAVCLQLFLTPTTLGCGHTFCAGCVRDVRLCPMCRAAVTTSSRSVTLDSIVSSVRASGGERM